MAAFQRSSFSSARPSMHVDIVDRHCLRARRSEDILRFLPPPVAFRILDRDHLSAAGYIVRMPEAGGLAPAVNPVGRI